MDLRDPSRIKDAPSSRAFSRVPPNPPLASHLGNARDRGPTNLPAALAFLSVYGVDQFFLAAAAEEACQYAVAPEAALLASGTVQEIFFYRCLQHYLGVAFIEGWVRLGAGARYPSSIHRGIAPLDGRDGRRWLAAPRGEMLAEFLTRARRGERFSTDLVITTPSHMSRLLRAEAAAPILRDASLGLASLDPALSAKAGLTPAQRGFAMTAIAGATFALGLAPLSAFAFISLSMTCFFLASIWLRLFAGAASTASVQEPYRPSVEDRWLPVYSIAVALHREARVVP